jgi:ATP-dependent 26S proteasome regulatory subunit
MSVERDIRYDLLARLCPNSTGAEIRSVCTEAGMFAIRSVVHDVANIVSILFLSLVADATAVGHR